MTVDTLMADEPPSTPEEFSRRARNYVEHRAALGAPVLLSGMLLALGLGSRRDLDAWAQHPDFGPAARQALLLVIAEYEAALRSGSASGPIFALKHLGWSDKPEAQGAVDAGFGPGAPEFAPQPAPGATPPPMPDSTPGLVPGATSGPASSPHPWSRSSQPPLELQIVFVEP